MKPSDALRINRATIQRVVEAHRAIIWNISCKRSSVFSGIPRISTKRHFSGMRWRKTQWYVFEVIGEASRNIERRYPQFATNHPELPLAPAYEIRNALAHGYFKVDLAIVWKTLENDLPNLQAQTLIQAQQNNSGTDKPT